ncbi:MAG: prepilin-type N-terminal cleavage/methylation domain-containing protein, partial [Pseudomonadota bacterium]|nr:prepilin-type N-terminal cleavage/methylation domain-containing protein [Pseudomonadota bacterium]
MSRSRLLQRGLSLVELMVGITIGLFVVAAAATLVSVQLADNRRLLLETQMQQDLRATADIIGRELRRAGSTGGVMGATALVWRDGAPSVQNPNLALSPTGGVTDHEVSYW